MSMQRHCSIYLAKNGKWYMELGISEHDRREDSVTYGPFNSLEEVDEERRFHSNPGGSFMDDSGKQEAPVVSPNGFPIRSPSKRFRH